MNLHTLESSPAFSRSLPARRAASRLLCGSLLALASQGPAQAQAQKLAPGLWENTTKINIAAAGGGSSDAMARMQKEMASMPPAQRKMVEDMMAKQGVGKGAQPDSVRVCISREQAEKGTLPQDGRCTQDSQQRSGNSTRMKFSCQGPPPSNGEAEYSFSSDKAYTGRMKITTTVQGQPTSMEMETTGRWISADCGALKPPP